MNEHKKKMIKVSPKESISGYDIIAIISGVGIIGWIMTDFFGGMLLFLIAYSVVIIPVTLLYTFSFFDTLISLIRKGRKTSKLKIVVHATVILTITAFNVYHSDLLKSEKIMVAVLKDDQYQCRLVFRKNCDVENQINGIFGSSKIYQGKYKIEDSLIIFTKKPYENNFIPDTVLLDKKQGAIFIEKNSNGQFNTKKEWLNHFAIE